MYKQSLAALFVMATLAGCASTKVQNPVNYITFRNEPLVKDVEKGMSQQEVLRIGGTPSGTQKRLMKPGSCNSYILNKDGQQQPFYVSFDGSGKVDGSGFLSCSELDRHERDARPDGSTPRFLTEAGRLRSGPGQCLNQFGLAHRRTTADVALARQLHQFLAGHLAHRSAALTFATARRAAVGRSP